MRILITGASGLIGKEVGKRLAMSGHEISVISRRSNSLELALPFPAQVFQWNPQDDFPSAALDGVDAVVHLAGEPVADGRWTEERKKKIRDSRVIGTRKIVDALLAHHEARKRLKAFVLGSAIGYYGARSGDAIDEIMTEESPVGTDFLAEVVRDWESEALRWSASGASSRLVVIRTGVVLSRRGGALAKMLPLFTRGLGGRLSNGKQWMSWIHIDDIARLFAESVENDSMNGVYNGTAPEPARNERFTVALARAVGRSVFLPVPETALKLAMGEMSTVVLGSQRVTPNRAQEAGFRFDFPELVPALEELGEPLKHNQHEMVAEQWIPQKPDEIFPFFCSETNLEEITPPFLGFKVLGKSTPEIGEGTLIDYRLSLHGLPMGWQTRIESWKPSRSFVDSQIKGPYQKWHHTHEFIPMSGGTLMRDRVLYRLPLGLVGDIAAGWKVSGDVQTIFRYRREKVEELFVRGPK